MIPMTIREIRDACRAELIRGDVERQVTGICTDSRKIKSGELFVALKGESFDGHEFVEKAIAGGAGGVVVSKSKARRDYPGEAPVLAADDSLDALGDLAAWYRSRFTVPFVAITGSNGKTTTKEMVAHVLSARGKVIRPEKSFNNFIGLPLTVFEVVSDAFAVVLEMGTSAPGEIARLCAVARPTLGVITNVGPTHLLGLGSVGGVAGAKAELLDALPAEGLAVLNADNEWTPRIRTRARCKVVTFGLADSADVRASDVRQGADGLSFTTSERVRVEMGILGRHNVHNALAAIAVCRRLGMSMSEIAERLATFKGVPMRMELVQAGGVTVINDAYNANPVSMAAAVQEFEEFRTPGAKHLVCGDMLELGEKSAGFHRELGRQIASARIDRLWLFGKEVAETRQAAADAGFDPTAIFVTSDYADLERALVASVTQDDAVLIKGSRRMKLERLVDALRLAGAPSCRG
jgi:UDP-N-acetylmuramoyl-tripeptide--D-alanyl-D-alanine ligase